MDLLIKNDKGEIISLKITNADGTILQQKHPILRLISLSDLPNELLLAIFFNLTDPRDVVSLSKTSKRLNELCKNKKLWRHIAFNDANIWIKDTFVGSLKSEREMRNNTESDYAKSLDYQLKLVTNINGTRQSFWFPLFLMRLRLMNQADRLWNHINTIFMMVMQGSLRKGATESEIEIHEHRFGISFPEEFRASLKVCDGQIKEFGHSIFDGAPRLLTLREIGQMTDVLQNKMKQYEAIFSDLLQNELQAVSESDASITNNNWIPLTPIASGYKEWILHAKTGAVFLISGFELFKRADSWFGFLRSLVQIG